jgi:hypothetical protein
LHRCVNPVHKLVKRAFRCLNAVLVSLWSNRAPTRVQLMQIAPCGVFHPVCSSFRLPPPLPQPCRRRDSSSPSQCPPPLRAVLCLWEGGELYMLDPRTLETISLFDILCRLGGASATDEAAQDDDSSEAARLGPGGHGCMRQGSMWPRACWDRSSVVYTITTALHPFHSDLTYVCSYVSSACWPSCYSRTTRTTKRGTGL